MFVFGSNESSQLGLGDAETHLSPVRVNEDVPTVEAVGVGSRHLVLLTEGEEIYVCGCNSSCQLGFDSNGADVSIPVRRDSNVACLSL